MNFQEILSAHIRAYPKMQPTDAVKLAYQSEFGPGHMITDLRRAEEWIEREAASVHRKPSPPFEEIGGGYVRFHLARTESARLLSRAFVASAADTNGTLAGLLAKTEDVRTLAAAGAFEFSVEELERYLRDYEKAGFPAVRHSERYRELYAPAYRVVCRRYAELFPLFTEMERLELSSSSPVLIAIDGPAASGKTSLAKRISEIFDCNVFHMDDFFLPPSLRTPARFAEAGGNVHYERFREEVLQPLCEGKAFSYGVFDCSSGTIREYRSVEPKKLNVIEGVYARHPYFGELYALRIFVSVSPEEQERRVLQRNGAVLAESFRTRWIPMENRYFDRFHIESRSDVALQFPIESVALA